MKRMLGKLSQLTACLFLVASILMPQIVHADAVISISNCQDLEKIGTDESHPLDGSYVLTQNIDCSTDTSEDGALWHGGLGFQSIGLESEGFTGTFNGQFHTISGVYINRTTTSNIGLFSAAVNATIKDLQLVQFDITGQDSVGAVVGSGGGLTLNNIFAKGDVSGRNSVGSIIGQVDDSSDSASGLTHVFSGGQVTMSRNDGGGGIIGLISNDDELMLTEVASSANVTATQEGECGSLGGLVGDSDGGLLTISQSFANGNITAVDCENIGGLVGFAGDINISNSFSAADVTGFDNLGNLIGHDNPAETNVIDRSYGSGSVLPSKPSAGALVGENNSVITRTYFGPDTNYEQACGIDDGDCSGASGLNANQMKVSSNFTGWNFVSIWAQDPTYNSGLPYLNWFRNNSSGSITDNLMTKLVLENGCMANHSLVSLESDNAKVDSFDYPDGMFNFVVGCDAGPAFTTQITLYFYNVDPTKDYIVRKYNPTTESYSTITGATTSNVTVDGKSAVKVTYAVTDGGALDADGTANGVIEDPVGLAIAPTAPNTGYGQPTTDVLPVILLLIGTLGLITITRRISTVKN